MKGRFLCHGCNTVFDGLEEESERVCAYCNSNYQQLMRLYTQIVSERPKLRNRSPFEVFHALWDDWKAKEKKELNGVQLPAKSSFMGKGAVRKRG